MTCPFNTIIANTIEGKATGIVSWKVKVTDNSVDVDPTAKITVKSSHQPLQEFPIGITHVRVTATDSVGYVAICSFCIEIRGKTRTILTKEMSSTVKNYSIYVKFSCPNLASMKSFMARKTRLT